MYNTIIVTDLKLDIDVMKWIVTVRFMTRYKDLLRMSQ